MRRLKRDKRVWIDFCESCGLVCNTNCRVDGLRDAHLQSLLRNGLRIA